MSTIGKTHDDLSFSNTNQRVGIGLSILNEGLRLFIEAILKKTFGGTWIVSAYESIKAPLKPNISDLQNLDTKLLLQLIINLWNTVFSLNSSLDQFHRSIIFELRSVRNEWAHQIPFSNEDTYRALDNMERLLKAINANSCSLKVRELREQLILEMAQLIQLERHRESISYNSILSADEGGPRNIDPSPLLLTPPTTTTSSSSSSSVYFPLSETEMMTD